MYIKGDKGGLWGYSIIDLKISERLFHFDIRSRDSLSIPSHLIPIFFLGSPTFVTRGTPTSFLLTSGPTRHSRGRVRHSRGGEVWTRVLPPNEKPHLLSLLNVSERCKTLVPVRRQSPIHDTHDFSPSRTISNANSGTNGEEAVDLGPNFRGPFHRPFKRSGSLHCMSMTEDMGCGRRLWGNFVGLRLLVGFRCQELCVYLKSPTKNYGKRINNCRSITSSP